MATRDRYDMDMLRAIQKIAKELVILNRNIKISLDGQTTSYDTVFTTENVNDLFDYVKKYQGETTE